MRRCNGPLIPKTHFDKESQKKDKIMQDALREVRNVCGGVGYNINALTC
jgi:hypothetical protein